MSTSSAIKWSSELVDKDNFVSICAFSLNGHDSLCSILATRAVYMVPTLGNESTNRQFTQFHSSAGQQYSSSLPVWRYHNMLLQAFTCHFLAEAVIIISHVISDCMCSMPHVVKCYVCSLCLSLFMSSTFWYWWQQCLYLNTHYT
jgi:hypothetical protein